MSPLTLEGGHEERGERGRYEGREGRKGQRVGGRARGRVNELVPGGSVKGTRLF